MGNVHNLDIYPHTGERSCLGCVEVESVDDAAECAGAPGAPGAPAPGWRHSPRSDAVPVAAAFAPPEPRPVLVAAHWERDGHITDGIDCGELVDLVARCHAVPDGTCATITVSDAANETVVTLAAAVRGSAVRAAWRASAPGYYRFTVESEGASATSPDLLVPSWIEVAFVNDGDGARRAGIRWRLQSADGAAFEGVTTETGLARLCRIAPGAVRLSVSGAGVSAPRAGPDGHHVLAGAARHDVRIAAGLAIALRMPRSTLPAGVVLTVLDEAGLALARHDLRDDADPRGDHVAHTFPEVAAGARVSAQLAFPDGTVLPLFTPESSTALDCRQAWQPDGELVPGAPPSSATPEGT